MQKAVLWTFNFIKNNAPKDKAQNLGAECLWYTFYELQLGGLIASVGV